MVFVPDGRIRLKADVLPVLLLFIDLPVFAAAAGDEEKLKLPVASAPLFFPSLWFQWLPWLHGELWQRVKVVEPGGKNSGGNLWLCTPLGVRPTPTLSAAVCGRRRSFYRR